MWSHTLTNGWFSVELNFQFPSFSSYPIRIKNPKPFTKSETNFGSQPSRADWSSSKPRERSRTESDTNRHSSRTDWSTTVTDAEVRQKEIASLPASDSEPNRSGADRNLEKMEITANLCMEGWGTRVFSSNVAYEAIPLTRVGDRSNGYFGGVNGGWLRNFYRREGEVQPAGARKWAFSIWPNKPISKLISERIV